MGAQEIEEWRVGVQVVLRIAVTVEDSPALGTREISQLVYESCLPDSRLAGNQSTLAMPTTRILKKSSKGSQRLRSTY